MRRRRLAMAVILTVLSGCDNVTWGGAEVHLQKPPADTASPSRASEATDTTGGRTPPPPPEGPVLLAGSLDGASATLSVVGSVRGDGLEAFTPQDTAQGGTEFLTEHHVGKGSRLVLFAEGVRVGHLTVASTGVNRGYCVARPTVTGVVEMVPAAVGATRFLALPDSAARGRPYGQYQALRDHYEERVASLNLASAAIPQVGAAWPPSLLDARADIQVFQLPRPDGLTVAATFLYHDQLTTARPGPKAYALFVMGSQRPEAYVADFVWYRSADAEGKGAPRYFGHLDLNGDGQEEVLLDVLGSGTRWFAVLGRRNGNWVRTFQDPCGDSGATTGG